MSQLKLISVLHHSYCKHETDDRRTEIMLLHTIFIVYRANILKGGKDSDGLKCVFMDLNEHTTVYISSLYNQTTQLCVH